MAWLAALGTGLPAAAGLADVVSVRAHCEEGVCVFSVAVRHADEDFEHYADRYEVLAPDGTVLGTRVLAHPHVNEQPFTRLLPGIRIPEGVDRVRVRAHDSRHGFGGHELELRLALPDGDAQVAAERAAEGS